MDEQNSVEQKERLSDADRHALEIAKLNRKVALLAAEKALAESNAAELSFKYTILEMYMRNGLTAADAIDENGYILRGATHSKE